MNEKDTITIGGVVAGDFRTASVFQKHGIDFCCGGNIAVATACREKGIDPAQLQRELDQAVAQPLDRSQNYAAWELPFLADYIVNTHHVYLKENTGVIASYARKIAEVHGAHHPEVIEIATVFDKIASDMAQHLRDEEERLFPAIKKIVSRKKEGAPQDATDSAELKELLAALSHDHDDIGAASHVIRSLAKEYAVPEGVCNTFVVTYKKLQEFEDDLHKHVHLENNILFPKAAKL